MRERDRDRERTVGEKAAAALRAIDSPYVTGSNASSLCYGATCLLVRFTDVDVPTRRGERAYTVHVHATPRSNNDKPGQDP